MKISYVIVMSRKKATLVLYQRDARVLGITNVLQGQLQRLEAESVKQKQSHNQETWTWM